MTREPAQFTLAGAPVPAGGIVLAAGSASRFGSAKLAVHVNGRPVVAHVVDAARRAGLERLVVVVGHHRVEVERAVAAGGGARTVANDEVEEGLASSIRCGLRTLASLPHPPRGAVLLLGDEPDVLPVAIREVAVAAASGSLARARYDDGDGHPVGLPRRLWDRAIREVSGDRGLATQLRRCRVEPVLVPGPRPRDIDHPSDLGPWADDTGVGGATGPWGRR